jgi:hypothetical protein
MRKEIGRYRCVGKDGREYTVVEFQNFGRYPGSLTRPPEDYPTTKECFLLSDGSHVNYIDENTFQIVLTDQIVRKIS